MSQHFLGLRTVGYRVGDKLYQAKMWYERVLGFKPYFDEPFYVGFNVGGFELGLQPDDPGPEQTRANGVAVFWGVAKCGEAYERLLALGASPAEPPQEVGGGIVVATVRDPFGNLFGVIENPHFQVGGGASV
ncbi:MAG: VOC family protein [Verrucomicrobia bacterium]|nr:VOC family protein [Verrucomicrobiota bacterium]